MIQAYIVSGPVGTGLVCSVLSSRQADYLEDVVSMEIPQSGIVTFIVTHRVSKGRADEFETVNRTLNRIVESAPGYLGINVIRTAGETHIEYTVVLRFDSYESLREWAASPERIEYVNRLREISDHSREKLETGLEYWFTIEGKHAPSPPKYKMAAVTILVIYPLVILVPWAVNRVAAPLGTPFLVEVLISVVLITGLMTYHAMPAVTRLFSRWLYSE